MTPNLTDTPTYRPECRQAIYSLGFELGMYNRLQAQKRHRKSTGVNCCLVYHHNTAMWEFVFRNPNMTEHDVEDQKIESDHAGINLSQPSYYLASKMTFRKINVNSQRFNGKPPQIFSQQWTCNIQAEKTTRKLQSRQRLLVEEGGGGSKGTVELVEVAAEAVDPSKLLAVVAFARPGIDIENVCPSLRL